MFIGWMSFLDFSQNPFAALVEYQINTPLMKTLAVALDRQQWGLLMSYVGLALLVTLPVCRVLMTTILFIKHKEKVLAFAAAFVFTILLINFAIGLEF